MPRIQSPPPAPFRDGGRLAVFAVVLLCCAGAGDLVDLFVNLHIASVTDAIVHRPSTVDTAQIDEVNRLRGVARWLPPALTAAAAAPFLAWFRRSWLNARSFVQGTMDGSAGWAVGCWFVPVGFFWMPLRVAHEIRRGSALPGGRDVLSARLVNLWWALWLAKTPGANLLGLVLSGVYVNTAADDSDLTAVGAHADAVAGAAGSVLSVLAAAAAVLVVRAVTAQQRARAAVGGDGIGPRFPLPSGTFPRGATP